jgi:hypothetical protein
MFKLWADICVNGLAELKARSPLPASQRRKGQ